MGHAVFVYRDAVMIQAETVQNEEICAAMASLGLGTLLPSLKLEFARLFAAARSGTGLPILLHGPTGVGKEIVANAVHALSGKRGRFIAVNCAAISESLAESELFGHRKGAFSGASQEHPGLVRSADKGTLFLDEIGDLPLALQGKLLRVLQEREVLPVGETRPVPVDLLVVTATHRNLDAMVNAGTFRQDLLARLAGFVLTLPRLVERREDLGLIIRSILGRLSLPAAEQVSFRPAAVRALFSYPWPLNVREIEQCLLRSLALARDHKIDVEHLPDAVQNWREPQKVAKASQNEGAEALAPHELRQRDELDALLRQHNGNIARVADMLGKHRMQVQRLVKRFCLQPERYRK
jgi:transcriptional regulator with GAF, ATPase, and Fis domain